MFVVLILNVADVKKSVPADTKVNERSLDAGFDINHAAFVDVADVLFETTALDVQFFKNAIFYDGNSALLRLEDIDQHFFFHCEPFVAQDEPRALLISVDGRRNVSHQLCAKALPVFQVRPIVARLPSGRVRHAKENL